MKKMKFRVSSWDKSQELMQTISKNFTTPIENRDSDLLIENSDFRLRFHPDDRGFGFITCKIFNEEFEEKLNNVFKSYNQN
ncbi:MAG: hypothetical protein ACW981_03935 [Candidatus Hodarchaeales archaeon]|jgi:hypothetical protein